MVKFLDLPRKKSTGEKVMEGLGLATQSIGDMIGAYHESKQMDKFADYVGLEGEKRKAFLGLPKEFQAKVIPSLISEAGKKKAMIENLPLEANKILRENFPEIALPSDVEAVAKLAQKYANQGFSKYDSFSQAVKEFQGVPQGESGQFGAMEQAGLSDKKQGFGMLPEGEQNENPLQWLTKERGNIDPSTGRDISGHRSLLNKVASPSSLKSKDILSSIGLGTLEPIEDFIRGEERGTIDPVTGKDITGHRALSNYLPAPIKSLVEKTEEGKTPEEIEQMEAIRSLSAFIPIGGILTGLTKIGRNAGFLKNAEKIAAKAGISAEEAAQTILKQAEKEGVDLGKVAQGDKQEAGKLYNLSNRVSREVPETATGLRMERAKPAEKAFPTKERIATRETQLKEFPKYEQEIAQDALERAERAEKRMPKTVKGRDSQRIRIHEAQKALPQIEEGYRKAIARVRALEDEAVKLKGPARERINALLDASKAELRDAEFALKQGIENLRGESYRAGLTDMREAAQKKLIQISEDIADGKAIDLKKMDYNPEMIKEAKRISERKPLPAVKHDDFYQQVHKEYGDVYRKRLAEVDKDLQRPVKSFSDVEAKANLQKEKGILQKLIDQTEAERTIHRHKLAMRETAERQKATDRLKQFKKTHGSEKVEKVAKEKIEEAARNPHGPEAEEVAQEAGIPHEDIGKAKSDFKKAWEDVKEKAEEAKKAKEPKEPKEAKEPKGRKAPKAGTNLLKELKRFQRNLMKHRYLHTFTKTPVGKSIMYSLLLNTANDVLGLKISPYIRPFLGANVAMAPVRAIVSQVYHWLAPKETYQKSQYRKAIQRHSPEDRNAAAKFQKEHPKWAKEVRQNLSR